MENALSAQIGTYVVVGLILISATFEASPALAQVPAIYTNDNYEASQHDVPVSFERDLLGNFFGLTATGKIFHQVNVTNEQNIRLQKFSIDQVFFYISDRGVIHAQTDMIALSIYLART